VTACASKPGASPARRPAAERCSPHLDADAEPGGGDGFVAPEFLWAALDCPTGYATALDPARAAPIPRPSCSARWRCESTLCRAWASACVITAWETGREGRKRLAEAAAFGESGQLLAVARATWITVSRQAQLART
jgi:hypothetical protein